MSRARFAAVGAGIASGTTKGPYGPPTNRDAEIRSYPLVGPGP